LFFSEFAIDCSKITTLAKTLYKDMAQKTL